MAAMTDEANPSNTEQTAVPDAQSQSASAAATAATAAPIAPPGEATAADTQPRCPWCSEVLPAGTADRCPHCNAHLTGGDRPVPGLTEVETPGAVRARRTEPVKRSRLLSWISGEFDDPGSLGGPSATEALAPPPRDVKREMLRLQLEAEGVTVGPDGSIEYPTDGAASRTADASATDAAAPDPAVTDADSTTADEVRKAS